MEGDSTPVRETTSSSHERGVQRENSQKDVTSLSGSSLGLGSRTRADNGLTGPGAEIPELKLLTTSRLATNATFLALRGHLERFYRSKDRGKSLHPGKSLQWIAVLYSSLFSSLLDITKHTEEGTQLSHLDEVQKWFMKRSCSAGRLSDPPQHDCFVTRPRDNSASQASQSPPSKRSLTPTVVNVHSCPDSRRPSDQWTKCDARVIEALENSFAQLKTARSHQRNLDLWRRRKSRHDEEFLSKVEKSLLVARTAVPERKRYRTPSTSAETSAVKQPPLVQCQQWKPQNEEQSEPAEEAFPAVMSKMQRIRVTNRSVYQDVCSSGYYHYKFLDSMSAYHPREEDGRSANSVSRSLDVSEGLAVSDIRKKLARARVPCSYRALTFALSKPADIPADALRLPEGGEYLSSNPFFAAAKTKAKGKRRK